MGYGFDLGEWANEQDVDEWSQYMHEHMGWRHLLSARGRSHNELDIKNVCEFFIFGKSFLKQHLWNRIFYKIGR